MDNAELKNTLISLDKTQWKDWIMLKHCVAFPEIQEKDEFSDIFSDISRYFISFSASSKIYQEALLEKITESLDSGDTSKENMEDCWRLIGGLNSTLRTIEIGDKLADIFLSSKYEEIKNDKQMFNSELLLLLSVSKLTNEQKDKVENKAKFDLSKYIKDSDFWSSFLRFSYRQYLPNTDKFYENYIRVIESMPKENFTNATRLVLIDQLDELKYHLENDSEIKDKNLFGPSLEKWYPEIQKAQQKASMPNFLNEGLIKFKQNPFPRAK